MIKNRWISHELQHLDDYMKMLHTDIRAGNWESAETNWGYAMGIINGIIKRDKKSMRSIEKVGQIIGSLRKDLKPLLVEAGKIAIKAYVKEKSGKIHR